MSLNEEELRSLWQAPAPESNEDVALRKVLERSSNMTAVKDVTGLFFGWVWVVFLGFGASMYSAKRQLELHQQASRTPRDAKPLENKNNNGETQ